MAVVSNRRMTPGTQQMTRQVGVAPTSPQQSPALAAMAKPPAIANASPRGPAQTMTNTTAQPNGSTPGEAPRTDLVTPTSVDTSKQDQIYGDQLAQSDKDRELMQTVGLNTISGLQRRNASNAARQGLSLGGASYLSGQRSAAVQGINAFNQGLQQWGAQRQGIMGQGAGLAAGAAGQNASAANQAGMFNAGREGTIDDREAAAQAERNANQNIASVDQVNADFSYLFNNHNLKSAGGQYNSLLTSYKNSLSTGSPEEQAAAYQALMGFITPIQRAREAWLAEGGDKQTSFEDYYNFWKGKGKF